MVITRTAMPITELLGEAVINRIDRDIAVCRSIAERYVESRRFSFPTTDKSVEENTYHAHSNS